MSDLFTLAVCLDASMEGTGGRYDGPLCSLSYVEHYLRDFSLPYRGRTRSRPQTLLQDQDPVGAQTRTNPYG